MQVVQYIAIGLAVGLVSGALGIGGGVLMLPALMWICGMLPGQAAGTTLAVLVVPVVLPAAWEYYQRDQVNLKAAAWIALTFAAGGYLGAFLRHGGYLPTEMLQLALGLIMVYVATQLIVRSDNETAKAAAGLAATLLAWAVYLWLRRAGKRPLVRPSLTEAIQRLQDEGREDHDYNI